MSSLPKFGSKRWNEDHKKAGCGGRFCFNCGRLLLHPTSILRHFGGGCLKKLITAHEQIEANKSINEK